MNENLSPPDARVEGAIRALRKGRIVLLTHRRGEPPQGAAVVVAARTTPAHVAFMATHARGLVCVALSRLRAERLGLRPQSPSSRHPLAKDVLMTIEARRGVTTGISAADRARTARVVANSESTPDDLLSPGHVIPVAVSPQGLFGRAQIPEAAADLMRLAGFPPVATYCKVLDREGEVASHASVEALSEAQGLAWVDLDDIARFRIRQEILVTCESDSPYETRYGVFRLKVFRSDFDATRHPALIMGEVGHGAPLVRVHSQCLTGDVLGSLRCDCGGQLELALERIGEEGRGVLIYLLQEGRGIGLANKVRAYALQDGGQDTVEANLSLGFEADLRDFGLAAQILAHLGVSRVRLLTNNPDKIAGLEAFGIEVAERIPIEVPPDPHRRRYLAAKKSKLGHLLNRL